MRIADVKQYFKDTWTGAKTVLQTPGWEAKGNVLLGGVQGYVDPGNDGPDIYDAARVGTYGPVGGLIGSLNYIGKNQPAAMPQAQYVPTGNSVFGNSMGLDSYGFFANAPQSIGSNFYNTQPLSSFGQLMAPQYSATGSDWLNTYFPTLGDRTAAQGPAAPQAPVQAPVAPVAPTAPSTTISGIMGANKPTPVQYPNNAVAMYNAAPTMSKADMNAINMKAGAANMLYDPMSRTMKDTSISSRFDPMAGHNAFVKKLDMAKYAGELNPGKALEDAQFNAEMNAKLASMAQ